MSVNSRFIALPLCMVLLLAGCQKKDAAVTAMPATKPATVALVEEGERSRHFLAVHQQLELGGTVYGYADIDGDVYKLADGMRTVMEQMAVTQPQVAPLVKQDYRALFAELGFGDIKAVGLSSVPEGDGTFRNRVFLLTPDGRRGLLAGLGGKPGPFAKVGLAPADADLYSESEMDLAEIYKAVKAVVAKVGGDTSANLMEDKIKEAGERAAISLLSFVNDWKGHTATVVRFDPNENLALPGFVLPRPSILVCVDGLAPTLEPLLKGSAALKGETAGTRQIFRLARPLPMPGIEPVIVLDGTTFYFATSTAFLDECLNNRSGLADVPEFRAALARVSQTGNGLFYAHPRFFERLHDLERLNPNLPPQNMMMLRMVSSNLPKPKRPLLSVRVNRPDGILFESRWHRSLKQDVAAVAVYNPVSLGLMAAMAVPAFQKVRASSQQKAILNNLRQLSAAADQYYLEHGVDTVRYDGLVGPDKYVRHITPVAGEDYESLVFKQGLPLKVRTADGRVVQYPESSPPANPSRGVSARTQSLELEVTEPTRVKVTHESSGTVLFNGKMEPNQGVTLEKKGRLMITVESGLHLRMKVDGRNFPVPVEGYGRFALD
jgi:type II secretory pathway pseudopilin PulG